MNNKRSVYLDYSATTPMDTRVVESMMPYFTEVYGNASSAHGFGRKAESAIEEARSIVAKVLNCQPNEVVFTSGGSESDNLAVRGAAWAAREQGRGLHLITTPIEHSAVVRTINQLAAIQGFSETLLPVDRYGQVSVEAFRDACVTETTFASVMYANNEVGTVQPIAELAEVAHEHGIVFHTDAVQAAGQLSLDVQELGVDLMSLSGHKFYGPKGVGVLYVRDGIDFLSSQTGGSHEGGRRAGTHNTPFIVGLAKALELAYDEHETRFAHYTSMRDRLVNGVLSMTPGAELSGHPEERLPSHASFVFPGIDANTLLMHLDMKGVAASSASACKVGNPDPSGVLLAMGYDRAVALGSLRATVGVQTTAEDVDYAVEIIADAVKRLQKLAAIG
ncbi:MAG: cysteine desulfurase family protein [Chloroflexota bacterium]